MEKREAPQMVYKNGRPQGYRVGIGIGGAYGVCPFCGKAYTEEELEKSLAEKDDAKKSINFEHVYPRFAVKAAIDENKKFGPLEHTFLVAVHKECNTQGKVLEDTIKKLTERDEKGKFKQQQLTSKQARRLLQYCKKTSVLLTYLTEWENVPKGLCYDDEDIEGSMLVLFAFDKNNIPETLVYNNVEDFMITFDGVGLWYRERKSYYRAMYDVFSYLVANGLLVECKYNQIRYCEIKDWVEESPEKTFDKPILRNVFTVPIIGEGFEYALGLLPKYNDDIDTYKVAPLLRTKLALGGSLDKENIEVIFIQDGEYYLYKNGTKKALKTMIEPMNCDLSGMGITKLLNMTGVVVNNFDCSGNELISLVGCPQTVKGDFVCDMNNLESLEGAPEYVGGNFSCHDNLLLTLKGAPKEVGGDFRCGGSILDGLTDLEGAPRKVGGNFYCDANLTSLKGGPEYVGGNFYFYPDLEKFESLEGLPVAKSYSVYIGESLRNVCKNFKSVDKLQVWFNKYMADRKQWYDWLAQHQPKVLKSLGFKQAMMNILDMVEEVKIMNKTKRKTKPSNQNEK